MNAAIISWLYNMYSEHKQQAKKTISFILSNNMGHCRTNNARSGENEIEWKVFSLLIFNWCAAKSIVVRRISMDLFMFYGDEFEAMFI